MMMKSFKTRTSIIVVLVVMLLLVFSSACSTKDDTYSEYVSEMTQLIEYGDNYSENDMIYQAQYLYSFAGSSISALRFAIDNILISKNESQDLSNNLANEYNDWDSIAAVNYSAPYAYYFEGLLHQINGEQGEAEECYKNAIINSHFPKNGLSFFYLKELDVKKLIAMREELVTLEESIYSTFTPDPNPIMRNEMNFNDEYLRALAKDTLKNNPDDYETAESYYKAALSVNPFDTKNYSALAICEIFKGDIDSAIYYTNAGLWYVDDDELLNRIAVLLQN